MTLIKNVLIDSLTLLDRNPRRITKEQMKKLCESLKSDPDFLNNRPVLVHEKDGDLIVYAGNQRVRAAKSLGWKQIPCIVEKGLSETIIQKRVISDNKTFGEFDYDLLAAEWDTDLLISEGFTPKELNYEPIALDKEEKPKKCKTCPNCGEEL